jgi:2-keto-4-pentenoate hydratase/2-oxohepta-3-ene-1,7-dioic acid hydratase in catechol pathway
MSDQVTRYVRFEHRGHPSYGVLLDDEIREIRGKPWDDASETGNAMALKGAELLVPCEPSKILALAGNYRSHLDETPVPGNPEVFIKLPTCLLPPGGTIVIPPGTEDVHYEAELVVVIGKEAKNVTPQEADTCVFGVTCGNDVSARDWQQNDKQWWRAKASDTFGPLGPSIVRGLDYGNLLLESRLNGETKQRSRTSELIFSVPEVVSFISRHITLLPGDVIFTGTPGKTSAMKSGDVVEIELEGVGVLRNRIG